MLEYLSTEASTHPLPAPGEAAGRQEQQGEAGGRPSLTADCSTSFCWLSPVAALASCSSFSIASLDTQEEVGVSFIPSNFSVGPLGKEDHHRMPESSQQQLPALRCLPTSSQRRMPSQLREATSAVALCWDTNCTPVHLRGMGLELDSSLDCAMLAVLGSQGGFSRAS